MNSLSSSVGVSLNLEKQSEKGIEGSFNLGEQFLKFSEALVKSFILRRLINIRSLKSSHRSFALRSSEFID